FTRTTGVSAAAFRGQAATTPMSNTRMSIFMRASVDQDRRLARCNQRGRAAPAGYISDSVTFPTENRLGEAAQVAAEDLFALGPCQVGVENLGQLGGVGARRSVSAPYQPVHPHLSHSEIDLPGMGVGPAEFEVDVAV